jgi:hypothetical protein
MTSMVDPVPERDAQGHCPVCGGDLLEDVVFCGLCGIPHHEECWLFTGRCAIYACDGQLFGRRPIGPASSGHLDLYLPAVRPPTEPLVRKPDPETALLALSKRQAFREWLRDLLQGGVAVPQGWASLRASRRVLSLDDRRLADEGDPQVRLVSRFLLCLVPPILVLAYLGDPGISFVPELLAYLGLTAILHALSQPVSRRLIVGTKSGRVSIESRSGLLRWQRTLAVMGSLDAVAILDDSRVLEVADLTLHPGIVLVDRENRMINVANLDLDLGWHERQDEFVTKARTLARFLQLPFIGVVNRGGRRRRPSRSPPCTPLPHRPGPGHPRRRSRSW